MAVVNTSVLIESSDYLAQPVQVGLGVAAIVALVPGWTLRWMMRRVERDCKTHKERGI
jgi:hypothetical protein